MQWHPLFAQVLRPLMEDHYEVKTNMPVGDAPRLADIVLLRRTSQKRPPFRGLWRNLTPWNVFEFKGRTVSARVGDLDLLMEVGLGIYRNLNEEQLRQGLPRLAVDEASFWYVANELGRRFLRDAEHHLGPLEEVMAGVWRCRVLRRLVFLVSSVAAPVEPDTVPLHLLAKETSATEHNLAQLLVEEPQLWKMYRSLLTALQPRVWEEATRMARKRKSEIDEVDVDLRPLLKHFGVETFIQMIGIKEFVKEFGIEELVNEVGVDTIVERMGVENFLAKLSPAVRKQMKERMK